MNDGSEKPRPLSNQTSENRELCQVLHAALEKSPHSFLLLRKQILVMANPAAIQIFNLDASRLGRPLQIDGPGGLLTERIEETIAAAAGGGKHRFEYRLGPDHDTPEQLLAITVTPVDGDYTLLEAIPVHQAPAVDAARAASQIRHRFKTPLAVIKLGLSHFSHNYDKLSEQERLSIVEEITQEITRLTKDVDSLTASKK